MEPGGVLHMDERGVVGDGVVAVTPHSDFRYLVYSMKLRRSEYSIVFPSTQTGMTCHVLYTTTIL